MRHIQIKRLKFRYLKRFTAASLQYTVHLMQIGRNRSIGLFYQMCVPFHNSSCPYRSNMQLFCTGSMAHNTPSPYHFDKHTKFIKIRIFMNKQRNDAVHF